LTQHRNIRDNNIRSIPSSFAALRRLADFFADSNELTAIPSEIASWTALTVLNLENNKLSGTVPTFFSQLTLLRRLRLFGNALGGAVPPLTLAPGATCELQKDDTSETNCFRVCTPMCCPGTKRCAEIPTTIANIIVIVNVIVIVIV
jgi:hypothetical protein